MKRYYNLAVWLFSGSSCSPWSPAAQHTRAQPPTSPYTSSSSFFPTTPFFLFCSLQNVVMFWPLTLRSDFGHVCIPLWHRPVPCYLVLTYRCAADSGLQPSLYHQPCRGMSVPGAGRRGWSSRSLSTPQAAILGWWWQVLFTISYKLLLYKFSFLLASFYFSRAN